MSLIGVSPEMTAGDLVVGVGTLALAGFTAWLAWRTSREVKVGEEQLRLMRESIEALDVIPKHVVHPDLLGGWRCRSPSNKEEPDEASR